MIDKIAIDLPHGITLSCRVSGPQGAPVLVFLHGFPEAAFVWDGQLVHFGRHYRCIAPNLRGYGQSSAPAEVSAYRVKYLLADLLALVHHAGGGPLEALVAHDWGGAVAWNFAVQHPQALKRLVIINSPHPGIFLRELQNSPAQQAASAYMNFLCRPDAEALLSENGFERMFSMFTRMGAQLQGPGSGWLTDALRAEYRAVWEAGLTGALNFYRASPMRPPESPHDPVMGLRFAPEFVTVGLPTTVIWGDADIALPASLLDGLEAFVPDLTLVRIPQATHWIVHEQPQRVAQEITAALARPGAIVTAAR